MKLKTGLVVKPDADAEKKAFELKKWLEKKKVDVICAPESPERKLAFKELFAVFVLGGDGTFLRAIRWVADSKIPILGIKFGRLGFLAETTEDALFDVVKSVLDGNFEIDPRASLDVKIILRDKIVASRIVLNDVVVNKGALARLANIHTWIDDRFLTKYRGDGLIIATPTGSTAYSLAAGGPVIHPCVPAIIMTPICPFALTNRPLIVSDSAEIKIKLQEKASDIMLTFDGQRGYEMSDKETVIIKKGESPINMITIPGQDYYDILKTKLQWGGGKI